MNEPRPPPFTPGATQGPIGSGDPPDRTTRPVGWMIAVFVLAVLAAVSVTVLVMTIVLDDDEAAGPTTTETTTTETTTTTVPTTTAPDATAEFCPAWRMWEDELERASDVGPWVVDRWAELTAAAQSGPPQLRADVGLVARHYADLEAAGFELGATSAASDAEFLAASDRIDAWAAANC